MNNINQYIFDIDHFLAHLRDTLEYVLPKEHDVKIYEQRKSVLLKGLDPQTPLGRFFASNEEKTKDLVKKLTDGVEEIYGDSSTVITKTSDGKLRVDHSQHLKIYDFVCNTMEQLRDILFFHLTLSVNKNENDQEMQKLLVVDDRYYRVFTSLLMIQDFQKSFIEFQKVMSESQGKPTPQSNFIVQNELAVYANMLRNIRYHNHFTDNLTLNALDEVVKLLEMTEGRRDRIDNKPFPDLFKAVLDGLSNIFKDIQPEWQTKFQTKLNEMLEQIKINTEKSIPQA